MITIIPPAVIRLYKLLPRVYRLRLLGVGINVFIMAFLDLIGIGVLLPVLLFVLNENAVSENRYLEMLYHWGGFESNRAFILSICLAILLFSVGRVLLSTWFQYKQNLRLFSISNYLSVRLFQTYYSNGYLFIKQNNSHKLINQINCVSTNLIQSYFIPYTQLVCECAVMLSILIGLILFNVYVFLLVLFTFLPITLIYYRFSRSRVREYGKIIYKLAPLRSKLLQQTFIGYTDMEMSNSFPESLKSFKHLLTKHNNISVRSLLLNGSLQKVLEVAIVSSIVVLIVATQVLELPSIGLIIGLFALAVYRVLPGLIRSTGYVFTMRGNTFAVELLSDLAIEDEIVEEAKKGNKIDFNHTISIRDLSFSYDKNVPVLQRVSLDIRKGDFIGFRGESGSGKSTLFHLLLGFLQPDNGGIYVDKTLLTPDKLTFWRSKIGYVSQQLFMIEGSLLDNIVMSAGNVAPDRERVQKALRLSSLDKYVNLLPKGVDTLVGEGGCLLSGGQRQRLGIARALYKQAEILMFDEATSSLDEATEHAINDAILRLSEECPGLTLLVISHRPESLAVCRHVVDIQSLMESNVIQGQ